MLKMNRELRPGTLLDWEWLANIRMNKEALEQENLKEYLTQDGRSYFELLREEGKGATAPYRRTHGILGGVQLIDNFRQQFQNVATYKWKILVHGKRGVGKTSTICKLAGQPVPKQHHETTGLQMTRVYWPCRLLDAGADSSVAVFQLEFWEYGEGSHRYTHIPRSARENVDAIMFLFSFIDKSSFEGLEDAIGDLVVNNQDRGPEQVCPLVIGTKFDLYHRSEISQRMVVDFQRRYYLPVLKIANHPSFTEASSPGGTHVNAGDVYTSPFAELEDIAPMANAICEHLYFWRQSSAQGKPMMATTVS